MRTLVSISIKLLLMATALLTIVAFSTVSHARPGFTEVPVSSTPWIVSYVGSDYNALLNQTSFTYRIQVTGAPALSHAVFELPVCAVYVSAEPSDNVVMMLKPDPTTGLPGLKFDGGQAERTTQLYTITLSGQYTVGEINYAVKGATIYGIGSITGPVDCKAPEVETYSISGTLFVDADKDGAKDAGEVLLANVTVALMDVDGNIIATAVTNASGYYEFTGLVADDYVVSVTTTAAEGDFNDVLLGYFVPTISIPQDASIFNSDVTGVDFGFAVDVAKITEELKAGDPDGDGVVMLGTGKTIGFWKHQHNVALTGKGRAQVSAAVLQGYLDTIETLYLVNPFQFIDANEFASSVAILSSTSSDATALLLKQLLGTELNEVAGLGLTGSFDALQTVLVGWGEYLAANSGSFSRSDLLAAKDIFDLINNTGE